MVTTRLFSFAYLILFILLTAAWQGCNSAADPNSSPTTQPGSTSQVLMGIYYNDHSGGTILDFQNQINHKLAVDFHYHDFTWTPANNQYDQQDVQNGLIPLIAWEPSAGAGSCVTASDVAAGKYNTALMAQAASIKALGVPVMLDFVPEMTDSETVGGALACFYGSSTWNATPQGVIAAGAAYVAAQHHVVDLFRAAGATNARWVFGPAGMAFTGTTQNAETWTYFYPGANYVDWIGMDHFYNGATPENFQDDTAVQAFYSAVGQLGKPLLIAQICAHANPNMTPDPQTQLLTSARSSIPTLFPAIKAFVYNNQTVRNSPNDPGDTTLYLQGAGLQAFEAMLNDPYFSATTLH